MEDAMSKNIFSEYLGYGLSVIPVTGKQAAVSWKQYQSEPATKDAAAAWHEAGYNVAIICGAVSGGVICIDFDVKNGNRYWDWLKLVNEEYPEILSDLVFEETPSGGYHVVFRSDLVVKNVKLAMNKENVATIETRGEGGYFVCAPSPGYRLEFNDFSKLKKISADSAEVLLSLCASLNEFYAEESTIAQNATPERTGLTPFDDFDSRYDIVALLREHGWKVSFQRAEKVYLQRPGKDGRGVSATWNVIPGRFYVFSTSTSFQNNHAYKPSAVYAHLVHGGDYSAAAKELFRQGYGKKEEQKKPDPVKEPEKKAVIVVSADDIRTEMADVYDNGYITGKSTGWNIFNTLYSVVKGQFTVVTGMPSHGKSEFLDAMAMNLAKQSGWKFAVFSPENYPVKMHYHKLIEKFIGKSLRGPERMTREEMNIAIDFISRHFFFIDATEEEINLSAILQKTEELIKEYSIDGLIIDPFNEIELDKPKELSSTEYIGKCLRISRKFARRNNIHLWIVAHPTKMQKNKDGEYPVPELYDIEGSAHWRNKADNGLCVWRNFDSETVSVYVQKIKYRYAGKPGEARFTYNQLAGTYSEI
jgi:hypothetical protein